MLRACPISFKQLDSSLVRIASFYVLMALALYIFFSELFILYFLAVDTALRVYGPKKYSPIFQASKLTKKVLKLKTKMADAGAKRLAGHFALMFVVVLIIGAYLEWTLLVYSVAAIFMFCSTLELLFDYCVGCKIYYLLRHMMPGLYT